MKYIKNNYIKIMCILCYINFLVLIPLFKEKRNKLILFHIVEGFNLFIIELISLFVLELLNINNTLIVIFFIIISLIGIKNVIDNNKQELPIINKLKIFK